uniref:Selenoprotein N n=1 Tax=Ornithorhynchus anatinus TaxID=9258 RepID=A0A6I8P0E3_ORNAN
MLICLANGTVVHHMNANHFLDITSLRPEAGEGAAFGFAAAFEDPAAATYAQFLREGLRRAGPFLQADVTREAPLPLGQPTFVTVGSEIPEGSGLMSGRLALDGEGLPCSSPSEGACPRARSPGLGVRGRGFPFGR